MLILNDGQIIDTESELEPKLNDPFVYKGRTFRISECHKSVIDTWEWIITLTR